MVGLVPSRSFSGLPSPSLQRCPEPHSIFHPHYFPPSESVHHSSHSPGEETKRLMLSSSSDHPNRSGTISSFRLADFLSPKDPKPRNWRRELQFFSGCLWCNRLSSPRRLPTLPDRATTQPPPPAPRSSPGCGTGRRRRTGRRSPCTGASRSPGTGTRPRRACCCTGGRTWRRRRSGGGRCWRGTPCRSSAAPAGCGTTRWRRRPCRGSGGRTGGSRSGASAGRRGSRTLLHRCSWWQICVSMNLAVCPFLAWRSLLGISLLTRRGYSPRLCQLPSRTARTSSNPCRPGISPSPSAGSRPCSSRCVGDDGRGRRCRPCSPRRSLCS